MLVEFEIDLEQVSLPELGQLVLMVLQEDRAETTRHLNLTGSSSCSQPELRYHEEIIWAPKL